MDSGKPRLHALDRDVLASLYTALSELNELIFRAKSADELLRGACEIAASSGDHGRAQVLLLDAERKYLCVIASAGAPAPQWLEQPIVVDDPVSPCAIACRTGQPAIAELAGSGYLGHIGKATGTCVAGAYPLMRGGACVGALYLESRDPDAFRVETGALLERMVRSLSHGLDALAADIALQRFRLAFDQSDDMIMLIDCESLRFADISESFSRLLGYRREEVIGQDVTEFMMTPRKELKAAYAALVADPNRSDHRHGHFLRRDGSLIRFESTCRLLRSEGPSMIVATCRNVRERLAAEEALRRKDAYHRFLIENVSDIICATDTQWRYVYASPSLERLLGCERGELIGRKLLDWSAPADAPALRHQLTQGFAHSPEPQRLKIELRRKDGERRNHEIVVSRGMGPEGEPIYIAVGRDITEAVRAEQALAESERRFRSIIERSSEAVTLYDRNLKVIYRSPSSESMSGYTDAERIGRGFEDLVHPDDCAAARVQLAGLLTTPGRSEAYCYRCRRKDGSTRWFEGVATNLLDDPAVGALVLNYRDVTDRVEAQDALAASEEMMRGVLSVAASPLLLVDFEGTVHYANPAASALFGRPVQELRGAPLGLPITEESVAEIELIRPDGKLRTAEMRADRITLPGGPSLVVSLYDLTERKAYENYIEHLANYDGLTGLPNRSLLRDRVKQAITHARRTSGSVALILVDLDHFKLVIDSYGHAMGDMLLVETACRLREAVRDGDTVARLGGDEFVILLADLPRPDDAAQMARTLAETLGRPAVLVGHELQVTASMGISVFPGDGEDLETLMQCADAAMYRAKDAGRNGYQFFGAEMAAQARARIETELGLRQAIAREELRLHFQPQVALASGEIRGFEALLRWQHPHRGMVSPAQFIPVAEDSGLILPVGEWALRKACHEAMAWRLAGLGILKVAVNLSPRQFWQGSITELVCSALGESGLPPEQLELEITESVVARDLKQVTVTLEALRRMGITVAIDDFGMGYSSLAYLRSLPIGKLKIDKSFIAGIPGDSRAAALIAEIVRLAHALSLEVVAEGVETEAEAAFLRDAGCEAMQGYVFSPPLPAPECLPLLRSGRRFRLGTA